jgi:hypothetical protein
MSAQDDVPRDVWLRQKVEYLLSEKGRVNGFAVQNRGGPWEGPWSWLDLLVGEVLNIYRVLEDHEEGAEIQAKRWRQLIGLDEDASMEKVESRLKEMREYFVEVERSWQVRKRKGKDAISP